MWSTYYTCFVNQSLMKIAMKWALRLFQILRINFPIHHWIWKEYLKIIKRFGRNFHTSLYGSLPGFAVICYARCGKVILTPILIEFKDFYKCQILFITWHTLHLNALSAWKHFYFYFVIYTRRYYVRHKLHNAYFLYHSMDGHKHFPNSTLHNGSFDNV